MGLVSKAAATARLEWDGNGDDRYESQFLSQFFLSCLKQVVLYPTYFSFRFYSTYIVFLSVTGHQQCLDLRLPREETRRIFKSDGQVPGYFLHGFFLNGPPPPRFVEEVTTNKKVLKRGNNSCDKEKVHYLPKKLRVSKQYKDCM